MIYRFPLEWSFHMHVNRSLIGAFVQSFPGGDVEIIADPYDDSPTAYRWSSPHLNGLTDPNQLGARAAALKALWDGALYVDLKGQHAPSPLGQPVEGLYLSPTDLELRVPFNPFSPSWVSWDFEQIEDPERHPVSLFLFLAHYSSLTKDMLTFLGANGPSWVALYAMKDFMKKGGWKEVQLATAAGASVSEIKRFAGTANSHAALGPFGRHGSAGFAPLANPMTHADAVKLILTCVGAFFQHEAARFDLALQFAAKVNNRRQLD
ncbi:hypothetical protein HF264_19645 [Rhizobium leguminosarum]|uniref:hypothetical protein n=1 Tax=Rhizobium leguminosarum TaxID=384 RepID=UPI001C90B604|nr:hypothetical protein [Rhizobium leguminosarum]MBY2941883.1 hypothetical protein [Rhizobium leguminosarum]